MKNANLDYSLIDQIEQHQKEKAAAEWQEKVDNAKRAGSLQARIEVAFIVVIVLLTWILIPEPLKRWGV